MRTLVLAVTLAVFGLASAAIAADGNHFAKGTKSYQKSAPSSDEGVPASDEQVSASTTETPQDISPAAGAEDDSSKPSTKEALQESMKLPRK
jgi:hypothetical protein